MKASYSLARKIAEDVAAAGGRAYYVGGCVRDRLRGIESSDVDVEVHGVAPETLERILDGIGRYDRIGKAFGIYSMRGLLDIAMPRREEATGRGHRDFQVYVDPYLGPEKAARRRDLTVNAMMEDVLTGQVLDFFGGQEDLRAGVLRHVDGETFIEDPLRVLRVAQFAARFSFRVAAETVELCRRMDLRPLAGERVWAELEKALLQAERPSVFFETLWQMDQLSVWFPELEALIGLAQSPVHHPEGDVWTHTMLVTDEAARLWREAAQSQGEDRGRTPADPVFFLLAALCHDLGKADTTTVGPDGRIHALGHEEAGCERARRFLTRLRTSKKAAAYVENMVRLHMRPNMLAASQAREKSTNHMFDRSVDPAGLLLLAKADALGKQAPYEAFLWQRLAAYRRRMEEPEVTGKDLRAAGVAPGRAFSQALAYAHKLHLAGVEKPLALKQTLAYLDGKAKQGIKPETEPGGGWETRTKR